MRYQVIESLTGTGNWLYIGNAGTWPEVWELHNRLKANNPAYTYHIIPA